MLLDWIMQHIQWVVTVSACVLLAALVAGMRKRTEADVDSLGGFIAGALLYHPLQSIRGWVSLRLSFDYAKRQLEHPATKYLQVPAREDVKLETDKVFVPLTLETDEKAYDDRTVLQVGNRLRIVGDPGSGKTTVLKRMLRNQCNQLARWRTAQNGLLPVLLELRKLKPPAEPDSGDWLLQQIEDEVKRFHGYEMESCADSFKTGRGLLVLFDGADEIGAEQYEAVEAALNGVSERLAEKSSNNVVVITMRSQFHLQVRHRFARQYPVVFHVKPFSPSDIYALLNNWPFRESGPQQAARIYSDLSDRPSLRELCTNPLVLSMYIADDQRRIRVTDGVVRNVQVPDSRTEFYKDVVDELLLRRREEQSGAQAQGRSMLRRERQKFFGGLAYHHLLNGAQAANAIPFADAVTLVKDVFVVGTADTDAADAEAERILRQLSSQTGLFSEEREGEQLRFIHLSFIEYFAALHVIEHVDNGWQILLGQHSRNLAADEPSLATRLREVFPFAVHLAHEKDKARNLADVCEKFADEQLKASCFLETKAYRSEAWQAFADQLPPVLRELLPRLQRPEDARRFYTIVTVLCDAEAQGCGASLGIPVNLEDFFRDLLQADAAKAFQAIDLMARYDAVAALRLADMCGLDLLKEHPRFLIRNTEQPAFLGQILQRAMMDHEDSNAWLVYAGMAALWMPAAKDELLAKAPLPALRSGNQSAVRFWEKRMNGQGTLFAQVLGNIAAIAPEASVLCRRLPYRLWRFVRDVDDHKYLRFALRRARVFAAFCTPSRYFWQLNIALLSVIGLVIFQFVFLKQPGVVIYTVTGISVSYCFYVYTTVSILSIKRLALYIETNVFLKEKDFFHRSKIIKRFFTKSTYIAIMIFFGSRLVHASQESVLQTLSDSFLSNGSIPERRLTSRYARREIRIIDNIRYFSEMLR